MTRALPVQILSMNGHASVEPETGVYTHVHCFCTGLAVDGGVADAVCAPRWNEADRAGGCMGRKWGKARKERGRLVGVGAIRNDLEGVEDGVNGSVALCTRGKDISMF